MNKSITIIIPNYNGVEILSQNLPSTIKIAQKYSAPIIIVDDKSTDNSVEMLKRDFPELKLIEKDINQGFSSTVNLGVKNAQSELVCLLNSDVIPTENFLDPLMPYFNDSETAAVGMQDFSDDKKTHGRGKFIFHRGFILHERFSQDDTNLQSGITGWVSCGSGLFSKKIWEELGGLDELLDPFYFEDVDYGYRAWKSGYKMYFESNSHVEHIHKTGAIKSNYDEKRIKTISYRNQFIFNWKNITDASLFRQHLQTLPKNIVIEIKNNNLVFIKGLIEAIKVKEQLKVKKNMFASKIKLQDTEILKIFANG
ncbi:MAG: glycosyltransferase [bacterium]|nr:glycosyltransferase [bacterium]